MGKIRKHIEGKSFISKFILLYPKVYSHTSKIYVCTFIILFVEYEKKIVHPYDITKFDCKKGQECLYRTLFDAKQFDFQPFLYIDVSYLLFILLIDQFWP